MRVFSYFQHWWGRICYSKGPNFIVLNFFLFTLLSITNSVLNLLHLSIWRSPWGELYPWKIKRLWLLQPISLSHTYISRLAAKLGHSSRPRARLHEGWAYFLEIIFEQCSLSRMTWFLKLRHFLVSISWIFWFILKSSDGWLQNRKTLRLWARYFTFVRPICFIYALILNTEIWLRSRFIPLCTFFRCQW